MEMIQALSTPERPTMSLEALFLKATLLREYSGTREIRQFAKAYAAAVGTLC
jgi:hypothetical protein